MTLHVNKSGLRVLGIAESFLKTDPKSRLAGVVMRGDLRIDGVAITRITVGGNDATNGVVDLFDRLDRKDVNAVMLNGNVVSWFNIIDPLRIHQILHLPVISLTYEESFGLEKYIKEYFPGDVDRLNRYNSLGPRSVIRLKTGYSVYVRFIGALHEEVVGILNRFTLDGRVPEPVKAANLVARAALKDDLEESGSPG